VVKSCLTRIWSLSKRFERFDVECQNHRNDNHISFELAKSSVYNYLNRFEIITQNLDLFKKGKN
jgi:hypothetical protein